MEQADHWIMWERLALSIKFAEPVEMADDLPDAIQFLNAAGDDEVRAFLRRLPMFAGNQGGQITITDLIYEMRLLPFVMDAWSTIDGQPGVPGRLRQISLVYAKAQNEFQKLTGETRRLPRSIDVPSFLDVYGSVGLP